MATPPAPTSEIPAATRTAMVQPSARSYQDHPRRDDYTLTESGSGLIPVLDALLAWGAEHAVPPDDPPRAHRYRAFDRREETP